MAAGGYPPDEVTAAMAQVISAWQDDDGAFHTLPPIRPPIESSDITATAMSLRAIQLYGSHQDEQVARAARWLRAAKPHTTEDAAMQLLGLAWAKARPDDIRKSTRRCWRCSDRTEDGRSCRRSKPTRMRRDRRWSRCRPPGTPFPVRNISEVLGFLLRTQFPDGSWLVRTRAFPVQMPKDSGFPHGRTSGSRPPAPVGRRWRCCWRCRRSRPGGAYFRASFLRMRLMVSGDTPRYDASIRCGTRVAIEG